MEKDENLISNSMKKKDLVTIYDTDFISCIQIYLSERYNEFFNIFYYNTEKDNSYLGTFVIGIPLPGISTGTCMGSKLREFIILYPSFEKFVDG